MFDQKDDQTQTSETTLRPKGLPRAKKVSEQAHAEAQTSLSAPKLPVRQSSVSLVEKRKKGIAYTTDQPSIHSLSSLGKFVHLKLKVKEAKEEEKADAAPSSTRADLYNVVSNHLIKNSQLKLKTNTAFEFFPESQGFASLAIRRSSSGSDLEEVPRELDYIWCYEFPKLTTQFYDDSGFVNVHQSRRSHERSSSLIDCPKGQANQYLKVEKVIWKSSFTLVMVAVMRCTGKKLVLKMINKKCGKAKRKMALTECLILRLYGGLCPFLVHFHSSFQTTLNAYLVMEHVEGGSLARRLETIKVYPERVTVFYLAEIILGMVYLHSRGVVHRDLRLNNILIKRDGHIRIIDFGLAKMNMSDNFTSTPLGGLREMSPEMHHGTNYNKAVDYWSCGVLLFAMLHGKLPFHGKTRVDIYKSVTMEKEVYSPDLDEQTVSLCKLLLKKNQKYRLGYEAGSETILQEHPFFSDVKWDRMERRLYTPPYVPMTEQHGDADQIGMNESTWPDIEEQNLIFSGQDPETPTELVTDLATDAVQSDKNLVSAVEKEHEAWRMSTVKTFLRRRSDAGAHSSENKITTLNQKNGSESQIRSVSVVPSVALLKDGQGAQGLSTQVSPSIIKPEASSDRLRVGSASHSQDTSQVITAPKDFGLSVTSNPRKSSIDFRASMIHRLSKQDSLKRLSFWQRCWNSILAYCRAEAIICRAIWCGMESAFPDLTMDPGISIPGPVGGGDTTLTKERYSPFGPDKKLSTYDRHSVSTGYSRRSMTDVMQLMTSSVFAAHETSKNKHRLSLSAAALPHDRGHVIGSFSLTRGDAIARLHDGHSHHTTETSTTDITEEPHVSSLSTKSTQEKGRGVLTETQKINETVAVLRGAPRDHSKKDARQFSVDPSSIGTSDLSSGPTVGSHPRQDTAGASHTPLERQNTAGARHMPPQRQDTAGARHMPPQRQDMARARCMPPQRQDTAGARRMPPQRQDTSGARRMPLQRPASAGVSRSQLQRQETAGALRISLQRQNTTGPWRLPLQPHNMTGARRMPLLHQETTEDRRMPLQRQDTVEARRLLLHHQDTVEARRLLLQRRDSAVTRRAQLQSQDTLTNRRTQLRRRLTLEGGVARERHRRSESGPDSEASEHVG